MLDLESLVDDFGWTCLGHASFIGDADLVRTLLLTVAKPGGDGINDATINGSTALTLASQQGRTEVVRTLLAVDGINVNHVTTFGNSALKRAAATWHVSCVRALVAAKGIDLNLASQIDGHTASFAPRGWRRSSCC